MEHALPIRQEVRGAGDGWRTLRRIELCRLTRFGRYRRAQGQRDWFRVPPNGSMSVLQKINGEVKPVAN